MRLIRLLQSSIVAAAVLLLLTSYLAFYYAPLPTMNVRTANSLASQLEGQKLEVVGFAFNITDAGDRQDLNLADLMDYQRWIDFKEGRTGPHWWTVNPLMVRWSIDVGSPHAPMVDGQNITAQGIASGGGPTIWNSLTCPESGVEKLTDVVSIGTFSAPVAQKIFYFHMPAAWTSYLAFGATLAGSALYLWKEEERYDRMAGYSVEIGLVFGTIAIVTGPIWAKEEWGVYWSWGDLKLVATLVLWVAFVGYLALRNAVPDKEKRARLSAVYGIAAFLTVPASLLGQRLLPSAHPTVIATSTGGLSIEAGITVVVAVLAFTCLYVALLAFRYILAEGEEKLEELKRRIGGEI